MDVTLSGGDLGGTIVDITVGPMNVLLTAAISENDTEGLCSAVEIDHMRDTSSPIPPLPVKGEMLCTSAADSSQWYYRYDGGSQAVYTGQPE